MAGIVKSVTVQVNAINMSKLLGEHGEIAAWVGRLVLRVEGVAKRICPVDTGRLRASISSRVEPGPVGVVGTNVEYAPYVELGTVHTPAQPFLTPALYDVVQSL